MQETKQKVLDVDTKQQEMEKQFRVLDVDTKQQEMEKQFRVLAYNATIWKAEANKDANTEAELTSQAKHLSERADMFQDWATACTAHSKKLSVQARDSRGDDAIELENLASLCVEWAKTLVPRIKRLRDKAQKITHDPIAEVRWDSSREQENKTNADRLFKKATKAQEQADKLLEKNPTLQACAGKVVEEFARRSDVIKDWYKWFLWLNQEKVKKIPDDVWDWDCIFLWPIKPSVLTSDYIKCWGSLMGNMPPNPWVLPKKILWPDDHFAWARSDPKKIMTPQRRSWDAFLLMNNFIWAFVHFLAEYDYKGPDNANKHGKITWQSEGDKGKAFIKCPGIVYVPHSPFKLTKSEFMEVIVHVHKNGINYFTGDFKDFDGKFPNRAKKYDVGVISIDQSDELVVAHCPLGLQRFYCREDDRQNRMRLQIQEIKRQEFVRLAEEFTAKATESEAKAKELIRKATDSKTQTEPYQNILYKGADFMNQADDAFLDAEMFTNQAMYNKVWAERIIWFRLTAKQMLYGEVTGQHWTC